MLVNYIRKNTNSTPAYGTIRYSGAIKFKENDNKYFNNSPRSTYIGFSPPCAKINKWSKKSVNNQTVQFHFKLKSKPNIFAATFSCVTLTLSFFSNHLFIQTNFAFIY